MCAKKDTARMLDIPKIFSLAHMKELVMWKGKRTKKSAFYIVSSRSTYSHKTRFTCTQSHYGSFSHFACVPEAALIGTMPENPLL